MKIKVWIKGDVLQAAQASKERGLDYTHIHESDGYAIGHVECLFSTYEKVVDWFTESGKAPYPVGSLMFYRVED